jgi:hypothetical protein
MPKTNRGFSYIDFIDRNDQECTIQQSSMIGDEEDAIDRPGSSVLWLGVKDANPLIMASEAASFGIKTKQTTGWVPYPIPEEVLMHTRMHLSRNGVIDLIKQMQHWVDTGDLPEQEG